MKLIEPLFAKFDEATSDTVHCKSIMTFSLPCLSPVIAVIKNIHLKFGKKDE